jgi:heavy metal sensor kinase
LVLATVLLLFIAGTSFVLYWQLNRQLLHFAVQDIETVEGLIFFSPDGRLSLREDYHNHPESRQLLERLLEILSPDGTVLFRNERLGNEALGEAPFRGEGVDKFSERTFRLRSGSRISLVSRYYPLHGKPLIIRLGYRQDAIWSQIDEFITASLTALPLLLAVAAFLGYQLARRALNPLEEMAQRAEQITALNLDQRLPVQNPADELGHLARVINNVLNRLEHSFQQLRRFTSDASHELRTPLAAIRSVGEVGLQKSRTAADYQDTIGSMLEEVTRLTRLVESLLTMSRADAGQLEVNITQFPLMGLVKEVASLIEVLAQERSQTLEVSGEENLTVRADRLLLRQAVINILHNAVKYSPVGGRISVWSGVSSGDRAIIRVSDSGPGIPTEHRERVFDRFYRVDMGRAREAGGAGLGLSIASWAVAAQGGAIHIDDSSQGAVLRIELPCHD